MIEAPAPGAGALGAGALGARRLAPLSTRGDGVAPLRRGVGSLGVWSLGVRRAEPPRAEPPRAVGVPPPLGVGVYERRSSASRPPPPHRRDHLREPSSCGIRPAEGETGRDR